MSIVIERKRKQEILEKIEQYGYDGAIVECALFRADSQLPYWNIYVLRIILQKGNAVSSPSLLVERTDFVMFRAHWTIAELESLLERIAQLREMPLRDGRHQPEERADFDICGYPVKVYGNFPGEIRFVGSYTTRQYYPLRFDRPYFLLEYAVALLPEGIRYTTISGLERHDPPFSSPAQAVNQYFQMCLDPLQKDFHNGFAGLIFPILGSYIKTFSVRKQMARIRFEKNDGQKLTLSVVAHGQTREQFNRLVPVNGPKLHIPLGFVPARVELNLFQHGLTLDSWIWNRSLERSGVGGRSVRLKNLSQDTLTWVAKEIARPILASIAVSIVAVFIGLITGWPLPLWGLVIGSLVILVVGALIWKRG